MVETMEPQCYYCGITGKKLSRCAQCKLAWYCSQAHQKSDWKQHKPICIETVQRKRNITGNTTNKNATSDSRIIENYNTQTRKPLSYNLQYDDYEIALSPVNGKYLTEYLSSNKEKIYKYADMLIDQLTNEGYCTIDGFLGELKGTKVLEDVFRILDSGIMKDGELVPASNKNSMNKRKSIRGDKIAWITGHEEQYQYMHYIINEVDRLIRYAKSGFSEYDIRGRTPAMIACYPGDGSGYKKHIDNTQKDGRCITCIYYLNKGWNTEVNGGQLHIYPNGKQKSVEIEPLFDRLFVFWSDKRSPHEVLPAYAERFALTLWYFDAVERKAVKEAYMSKLQEAFAGSCVKQNGRAEERHQSKSTND